MFVRNVLLTYLTEIICAAVNFATGVILARALSPADRGVMVLVMTLPNLMFNLLNFGLHESTTFFIGRKKIADNQVLGNSLVLVFITGGIAFGVLALLHRQVVDVFLKGLPQALWLPVALMVPAALIQGILLSMLRAKMRFGRMNVWRLISPVVMLLGFGFALLVFGADLRASVLVYFWLSLPLLILACVLVGQVVSFRFHIQIELMGDLLRYGLKSYLQGIISGMNYRLDVFLVALFLASEDVAFYGVAFALAEIAWFLPNAAGTVLFPRLANAPLAEVHQLTATASRVIFALTALIAAATALIAPLVPAVYGPAYWRSIPALLILLPGILMMTLHKVLGRNFASRGRQQYTVIASLISFLLILILDIFLIPRLGIEGAAVASSAGYFAAGLTLLAFYVRDTNISAWEVLLIKREDIIWLVAFSTRWRQQINTKLARISGKLWNPRSRPVTSTNAGRQIWTRANAGEILPDVVTPLSWSVFRAVLQGAGWYSGLFPLTLHWRWRLPSGSWADSPRLFSGRAYMELHSVYASFGGYPGISAALLQKVLGFEFSLLAPDELPERRPRWHIMDLYRVSRFWAEVYGLTNSIRNTQKRLQKNHAKHLDKQIESLQPAELLSLAGTLQGQAARMLGLHITCTALAFSAYGLYLEHLRKHTSATEFASLEQLLVADATQISTTRHLQAIWDLAQAVKTNPDALEILQQTQSIQHVPQLWRANPAAEAIFQQWEVFRNQFGGRSTQEFELSVPRWEEDPAVVLTAVKDAIQSGRGDPAASFQDLVDRKKFEDRNTDWRSRRLYQAYSNFVPLRENLKYDVVLLFHGLRKIYLRLGQILAEQGKILRVEDIFFLDQAEIRDHLSGIPMDLLSDLVAQHQEMHQIWQGRTPPAVIIRVGEKNLPFDTAPPTDDPRILRGIACSGGSVTAPAAILRNLNGSQTIPDGHILVTPSIDPGLTPLLLNAAGLVTEIGGILSHGATLAREFGLPAVVSVPGITQAVQDGQMISLDGFTGTVRIHPVGSSGGQP